MCRKQSAGLFLDDVPGTGTVSYLSWVITNLDSFPADQREREYILSLIWILNLCILGGFLSSKELCLLWQVWHFNSTFPVCKSHEWSQDVPAELHWEKENLCAVTLLVKHSSVLMAYKGLREETFPMVDWTLIISSNQIHRIPNYFVIPFMLPVAFSVVRYCSTYNHPCSCKSCLTHFSMNTVLWSKWMYMGNLKTAKRNRRLELQLLLLHLGRKW